MSYRNTAEKQLLKAIIYTSKDHQLPEVIRSIIKLPKVNKTTITKLASHTINCRLDKIEGEETGACAKRMEKKKCPDKS